MSLKKFLSIVPEGTDVLVDVSNLTAPQLNRLRKKYRRPLYVSTHKTFNYIQNRPERAGAAAARPVSWLIIRVPLLEDGKSVQMANFSVSKQVFTKKKNGSRVSLHYKKGSKPSMCSISGTRAGQFSHSSCEVDDVLIAVLADTLDLPVVTNDRGLKTRVQNNSSDITPPMRRLIRSSRVSLLSVDERGIWRAKG